MPEVSKVLYSAIITFGNYEYQFATYDVSLVELLFSGDNGVG